jgi:HAE1 family hydrophobic/amphiphilic exporter-1
MGQQIKLNQFATVTEGSGPSQLERRDKTASVTVKGQNVVVLLEQLYHNGKKKLTNGKPVGVDYIWEDKKMKQKVLEP